jgi:hypothetical protein
MAGSRRLSIVLIFLATLGAGGALASPSLSQLTVRLHDLHGGYAVIRAGYLGRAEVATAAKVTGQQLAAHGWMSSYVVVYRYRWKSGSIFPVVQNVTGRYSTPSGAHWWYTVSTHNMLCCAHTGGYRPIQLPQVGDESAAYWDPSGPRGFVGIMFRRGTYAAEVDALPGSSRQQVLILARLVDRRIRSVG